MVRMAFANEPDKDFTIAYISDSHILTCLATSGVRSRELTSVSCLTSYTARYLGELQYRFNRRFDLPGNDPAPAVYLRSNHGTTLAVAALGRSMG